MAKSCRADLITDFFRSPHGIHGAPVPLPGGSPASLPSPSKDALDKFAAFLGARREHITALWVEAIREDARIASTGGLDDSEPRDHLPKLFDDLADLLARQGGFRRDGS